MHTYSLRRLVQTNYCDSKNLSEASLIFLEKMHAVWAVFLAVLISIPCQAQERAVEGAKRPNIILIMADDLGREVLGSYGGTSYDTPNLDRLAATGMRFRHAYAQPLCTNTRVQLMTGQYNDRNWLAFGILDPNETTFGHVMQRAGYKTCIAGKWQLWSYDPLEYPGAKTRRGIGMRAQDSGFDEYYLWHTGHTEDKGSRYADPVIDVNGKVSAALMNQYGPDLWIEYINQFMQRHCDEPFFVYYPMALPHDPFVPTPDSPDWQDPSLRHVPFVDRTKNTRHFKDMVEYADKVVGKLVKKVDDLSIRENTIIFFYSDNGTHQKIESQMEGKSIQGGKGLTTDAGTRVPLIVNWPGTIRGGHVVDDLVDSTDFLPTLAELAGYTLPQPTEIDGESFLPVLQGQRGIRQWIYSYYDPRPGWDKDQFTTHISVRDKRYRLYSDGRMFDVATDQLEARPLERLEADAVSARRQLQAVLDQMAIRRGGVSVRNRGG